MTTPNFFLVGGPKCGTTAMYEYLRQHPQIFMPEDKEPHFFDPDFQLPTMAAKYYDLQSYLSLFKGAEGYEWIGEASVWYLYSEVAARNIYRFNPEAKIIVMLRSPLEMMHSLYDQQVISENEDLPTFEAAIAAEVERKQGKRIPPQANVKKLFYRDAARFSQQVRRYFDTFSRQNTHVIIYDDFRADTAKAYRDTLAFLGVDTGFQPEFAVVNANKRITSPLIRRVRRFLIKPPAWFPPELVPKAMTFIPSTIANSVKDRLYAISTEQVTRQPMSPALRAQLQEEFRPEVEQLSALVGRDLTHWLIK